MNDIKKGPNEGQKTPSVQLDSKDIKKLYTHDNLTIFQAKFIDEFTFPHADDLSEIIEGIQLRPDLSDIGKKHKIASLKKYYSRTNGELPVVHRTNGRRVFSPLTSLPKSIRENVTHKGKPLVEIDAKNSQPLLLVNELLSNGCKVEPELIDLVTGGDFYSLFRITGKTRDEIKPYVFSFLFNKQVNENSRIFKTLQAKFPVFVDGFIKHAKGLDSLAAELQRIESSIWIDGISRSLMDAGIKNCTIHDSVVIDLENVAKAYRIVNKCFNLGIAPSFHVTTLDGSPINPFDEIDRLIKSVTFNSDSIAENPTPIITIDDRWLATLGNISMITGKAKSRKTFLTTLILSYVTRVNNMESIVRGDLPMDRDNIYVIDTEQGAFDAYNVLKRIGKAGGNTSRIKGLRLRQFDPNTRMEVIERVIGSNSHNTSLFIIDGVRDLAPKGINDEESTTTLVTKLMALTEIYNVHILVVLHQNKNDVNARGHLGTELMNKSETVFSTTKDPTNRELTLVECVEGRHREFAPFAFLIDEYGVPYITEAPRNESKGTKLPEAISADVHMKFIDEIFEDSTEYSDKDLKKCIMNWIECGDSVARKFVEHYVKSEMIKNTGGDKLTAPKVWERHKLPF